MCLCLIEGVASNMMITATNRALRIFTEMCKDFKTKVDTFNTQLDTVITKEATRQIICLSTEEWEKVTFGYNELEIQYPEVQEMIKKSKLEKQKMGQPFERSIPIKSVNVQLILDELN